MRQIYYPLVGLLLMLHGGCHSRRQESPTSPRLHVRSAIAQSDTLAREMSFITKLESNFSAVIQPRVNAFLLRKAYRDGMPVKKGQLLFLLDEAELKTTKLKAEAALSSARAELLEAENNFKRAQPLARIEAISQSELDEYTTTLMAAKAAVHSAEQELRSATLNVGYTRITAPIAGIASSSEAHVGDYVGPGTRFEVLATLSSNDSIAAVISIPVREYLSFRDEGHSYENRTLLHNIRLELSNGSLYPYAGSYNYTLKDVASGEGLLQLSLLFPNPEGLLKAGEFARIWAEVGPREEVILVPERAVSQVQGRDLLWVILPDSTVEYREVELGARYDTLWSIRSGITAGERVATSGQLKFHQGDHVIF